MEELLYDIIELLRAGKTLDGDTIERIMRHHNAGLPANVRHYSKRRLITFYFAERDAQSALWQSLHIDDALEAKLVKALQMKPQRTVSGVAIITVLTKPYGCSSECIYCPVDIRMPKSYMSNEPACKRAEQNYFDPMLQMAARLSALHSMGHPTDKIEVIVLGGTWNDYSSAYRSWFVTQLFIALNASADELDALCAKRRKLYEKLGLSCDPHERAALLRPWQKRVNAGQITFNEAIAEIYGLFSAPDVMGRQNRTDSNSLIPTTTPATRVEAFGMLSMLEHVDDDELRSAQNSNEHAAHRMVGLVLETRPDAINVKSLIEMRKLGCTKVQIGIQSLDARVRKMNGRLTSDADIRRSFALLRLFGFKIHVHVMVNLYGCTPEKDRADYIRLVHDSSFLPDEVKLYPCVLVEGTGLKQHFDDGSWKPYSDDEMFALMRDAVLATPVYVRISRMIRDIAACDIIAGNKRSNLRQLIEESLTKESLGKSDDNVDTQSRRNPDVHEMRYREIRDEHIELDALRLDDYCYETNVSEEHFLQWVTPEMHIVGFCRLSLPHADAIARFGKDFPIACSEAMIRELHVYGASARIHEKNSNAQHLGLGQQLVARAASIAQDAGYSKLNVISSVGTRAYYRALGFAEGSLYQQLAL